MIYKYTLLVVVLLQSYLVVSQTTHWVSNRNDGIIVDFTTLQTAYDAASAGDTIIVYPSPYVYSGLTIMKKIHLMGLGYRIDLEQQPSLEISTWSQTSTIASINISTGGDSSSIESVSLGGCSINNVSECIINRCELSSGISYNNSQNNYLRSSYVNFLNYGYPQYYINIRYTNSSQNLVENCHFTIPSDFFVQNGNNGYWVYGKNIYSDISSTNLLFANNIFQRDIIVNNNLLYNNVFTGGEVIGAMNTIMNNVWMTGTTSADTNDNIYGATNVFVGYPTQGSYSFDVLWQLAPGSPAIGAGVDGVDCGIFDGQYPYKLSGIHNRPLIHELTAPIYVPNGSDLNITVKVRAEN